MAHRLYCFKLKREVPLLDEVEWKRLRPLLQNRIEWIKQYRADTGASLSEALKEEAYNSAAMALYEDMTGERLEHGEHLFLVRLSSYGAPCSECGKPMRTPNAKLCAECGFALPPGEVAGPCVP